MLLDRDKARKVFDKYVEKYDSNDEKIKLKIDHTYRVCELCEKIALSLSLDKEEVDIAWLTGLLHDIGRFEQVKRYGTFNDSMSVNHAKLSCEILFDEGKIREFIDDNSKDELIKVVIENHNQYKISEDTPKEYKIFSNILRDADKIDILKVNVIVPAEEIHNVSTEEIKNSKITKEVMDSIRNHDTILRTIKKTAVDNVAGYIALLFGIVYKESIKIIISQGYLNKILQFKSNNSVTNQQFDEIREIVDEYIKFIL